MNKKIILPIVASLFIVGCDYNKDNFDGLSSGANPIDIKKEAYTLADADYASIASNSKNKALAKTKDESASTAEITVNTYSTALAAIKTNKYFTDIASARDYLPAYLASLYPTADNNSSVKITYNQIAQIPDYLTSLKNGADYTLTNEDYKSVWGDAISANYFTPAKPLSRSINKILKQAFPDAKEGDIKYVNYAYSDIEPNSGSSSETTYDKIATLEASDEIEYNVKATIVGVHQQGYMIQDESGYILIYLGQGAVINHAIGEKVIVKGKVTTYNNLKQFTNQAVITSDGTDDEFSQPLAQELNTNELQTLVTAPVYKYVSYVGTLSVSGENNKYKNVKVDDQSNLQGSLSYLPDDLFDASMANQKVIVYGYVVGASKGMYLNTMVTSIQLASDYNDISSLDNTSDTYNVRATVVATYGKGFVVNDGTASILYYNGGFDGSIQIGDIVTLKGALSSYSGIYQFTNSAEVKRLSAWNTFTQPTPEELDGAAADAYISQPTIKYATYTGLLTITSYYNVAITGANNAIGSLSYVSSELVPNDLNNKNVRITGYLIGANTNRNLVNTMVTSCSETTASAPIQPFTSRFTNAVRQNQNHVKKEVAYGESRVAIYTFTDDNWVTYDKAIALSNGDYKEMDITEFSSKAVPENYLPTFLSNKYPYAQDEATMAVIYSFAGSRTASEYIYSEGVWHTAPVEILTDQFTRTAGTWVYNPSVTIELFPSKTNATSKLYYQTAVDWVWENVDQAQLGITTKGGGYVTSYGNNDYYTGCSAYQGNVDFRPKSAAAQYAAVYKDMSDEEIVAQLKTNLIMVMGKVLSKLHPDAKAIDGVEVLYTIKLGIYTGTSLSDFTDTMVYQVVGDAEFSYLPDKSTVK